MTGSVGEKLAHYTLSSLLGKGGMGEVYRARDTRLGRDVAIKVLPAGLADDPGRLSRFEREARMLAALNHPNVATLFGLEEHEGRRFLVMELVEGETLASRIARGWIPLEQALDITCQVARALAAAHAKGIVHRDLKPANVMLSPDGGVKVLDFGLARALESDDKRPPASPESLADSPTVSVDLTATGLIIGTAAYMSPEQATGKPVDRQADIWALGCLLWEMLTGRPAFDGPNVSEILASVLKEEPDWRALPDSTPRAARTVLRHCLEKRPEQRLHDVSDARIVLEDALEGHDAALPTPSRRHWGLPMLAIGIVGAAAIAIVTWLVKPTPAPPPLPLLRAEINLPHGLCLAHANRPGVAISPDGQMLAYVVGPDRAPKRPEASRLMVRRLDQPDAYAVPGVAGATSPVISPDGRWIAYSADGLYKVPVAGGEPVTICSRDQLEAVSSRAVVGLTWGDDDSLVAGLQFGAGLIRVPAQGGRPELITTVDAEAGELFHTLPHYLPGGRSLLFSVLRHSGQSPAPDAVAVWLLRLDTGERAQILERAADARFVSGNLVFLRDGALLAVPFDPDSGEVHGAEREVQTGVAQARFTRYGAWETLAGQYAVADNGTLVFAQGGVSPGELNRVVVVDRDGRQELVDVELRQYGSVRASPDGRFLLLHEEKGLTHSVWLHDLERGGTRRVLEGGAMGFFVWGPGTTRMTGARDTGDGWRTIVAPTGAGAAGTEDLHAPRKRTWPAQWTADGTTLIAVAGPERQPDDLWLYSEASGWRQLTRTEAYWEASPAISPDGRWLAFTSNRGGSNQVFVGPFDRGGPIQQVSGADWERGATWSVDGSELVYLRRWRGHSEMMAVAVAGEGDALRLGQPEVLFRVDQPQFSPPFPSWDCLPDGRFVFILDPTEEEQAASIRAMFPDRLRLVQGWAETLRQF